LSDSWFREVVEVKPLGGHRLHLRFDDGAEGDIDLLPRLTFRGVFVPLKDPRYFAQVRIEEDSGTIGWPSEANIDPVVLYSWVTGKPLPDFGADAVAEEP
jgi:hypothetical protein